MSDEKSVLITGGNSGIGFAIAKLFKSRNYQVVISGRNPENVEAAATALNCDFIVADVKNLDELKKFPSQFPDGLDVLVNCAGVAGFFPIEALTSEAFDHFIYTNVRAPLFLSQLLLSALEKKRGAIINISSIVVDNGVDIGSLYAASKGAVDAMVRSLALEFAPRGVRVNAVSPGTILTPIFDKLGAPKEFIDEKLKEQIEVIPLKRIGLPEEVAEVVLAQAEANYVTGAIWKVDGGYDAK